MFERLQRLANAPFSPHLHCYFNVPELVWLHVVSDLLIGLSYVAISLTLAYLVYRIRNLPFYGMFLAFGVFIISCGMTHFMDVLVVWDARYWLQGFVKALTAVSSVGTAVLLPPLVPKVLALARTARLSEERRFQLETAHAELERLYEQVKELDRLKREFFANVGRELHGRPAEAPAAGGLGEALVLVIEDNPDMRKFVVEALAPDFRTAATDDGPEGLEKALDQRPDLVVSDVAGQGEEVVRQVRARRDLDGVPVVLLTDRADDERRVRLLREGAADYLVKPFAAEELRLRVGHLVALKRARDVLRREAEGRQAGLEFLAHEVSVRKREAEAALEVARVAREHAEHAARVKGHFLRLVSHELRTPLTPLILNLAVLRRDRAHPLTPTQDALAAKIGEAAARLRDMIESILEYAGLQSPAPPGDVEAIDVAALAAEVAEEMRPQAERRGLALRLGPSVGLAPLHSDRRLVRLVFANLLDNALKFTERGEVEVMLTPAPGGVALAVRDTGPGIPADRRHAIFEPFEHLEPVQRKHTPGVGLGLTVVKELVQTLGGRIVLESEMGRGSTFTVVLPSLDVGSGTLPVSAAAATA
jgi:signal transduction histidine kinase